MTERQDVTSTADTSDWIKEHRRLYLRSGGVKGHVMDISSASGLPFGTHCLIRFKGRKSGRTMINALCYGAIGGEVVICASNGGADASPQWYQNILVSKTIDVQIATQAFRASWREPQGTEREKIWAFMVDCYPFYATYKTLTTRIIPLVMLKPIESLPVFTEADLTDA